MLFNSYEFLFLYLPVVLIGFFRIASSSHRLAAFWLAVASVFFYGWWNPQFVLLLLMSVVFNYTIGNAIGHLRAVAKTSTPSSLILATAVTGNLFLLGYFKYANFFSDTVNQIAGTHWGLVQLALPLGISFFTFTQIIYLVDVNRGIAREYDFMQYLLFVTYFPHVIAGPVLHYKQVMPQFLNVATYKIDIENCKMGIAIFAIGLFKKVALADWIGPTADSVFAAASSASALTIFDAWSGAFAYSFQLYFDFSGYSDMAIGLSLMLNVRLPINFDSPYKATNIIDFWRRWHITLSAFLRDYLYIPLGGNRRGAARRKVNLMITMLLGGVWHGAGWMFVIWGGIHGIFLVINQAWRKLRSQSRVLHKLAMSPIYAFGCRLITFICVVIAWVPFRSDNYDSALIMLKAMFGAFGIPVKSSLVEFGNLQISRFIYEGPMFLAVDEPRGSTSLILALWAVCWWCPNCKQLIEYFSCGDKIMLSTRPRWNLTLAAVAGVAMGAVLVFMVGGHKEFIYFNF